ncbi:MAG TPA: RIP metalloprotease RseP [Candidatus Acidoferrum sp.]|jgi:regulator of sigma E protease|nr:RIP metalloprotease RseP [Candidatus Acidoferrum sp.]
MHTAFGFILVLGVLILVHEWGHFIVARLFGVRVDVFSIGFGPRLFGVKRGATDYRVSAIPLGGYVRMAGQDLSEIDSSDQKPTGAPDELMSKKRWQRALISLAGPVVNLVFPIVLLTGYFVLKGEPYPKFEGQPLVVVSLPKDSPLAAAGVVRGDHIVSLNGIANPTWGTVETLLEEGPGKTLNLVVDHQGTTRSVAVTTGGMQSQESPFGYPPEGPPVVSDLQPGMPARSAGVKPGDIIESVNGERLESWAAFVDTIQQAGGKPIQLTVQRNGESVSLQITPQRGKNELGEAAWLVGIIRTEPRPEMLIRKVSVEQALTQSGRFTLRGTGMVLDIVGRLVSGKTSPKQLQSVIGIASMAGKAVEAGAFVVVQFMCGLSINLGILNLLPIPILDGGNILLLTLEGIRRRDFSLSFKERFVQVGLVFLLALFAYVMYNDVMRHLPFRS